MNWKPKMSFSTPTLFKPAVKSVNPTGGAKGPAVATAFDDHTADIKKPIYVTGKEKNSIGIAARQAAASERLTREFMAQMVLPSMPVAGVDTHSWENVPVFTRDFE